MTRVTVLLLLLLLPVAGCSRSGKSGDDSRAAVVVGNRPASAAIARFVGAGSCSASSCHGARGAPGSRLSEYTTWVAHDPHARAYEVLWDERSSRIAEQLGLRAAHEEALCLNCHVHPDFKDAARGPRFRKEDGVGCESCHGPAGRWLDAHYQDGWRLKTLSEKSALGMADTKSVAGRAGVCVGCHVGGPGADVSHDLIAAGHPPLRFEFAAFHGNLPRHWDEDKDLRPSGKDPAIDPRGWPDFEARAWAIGQVVSAQAALELLAARAARPAQWPEFASFDCFACHHRLESPSWRQARGGSRRAPGSLAWNDWYYALLDPLLDGADREITASLAEIKRMQERPASSSVALHKAATQTAGALRASLGKLEKRLDQGVPLKSFAEALLVEDNDWSWDRAAQCYLGLDALLRAGKTSGQWLADERLGAELERFRSQVKAPEGFKEPSLRDRLRLLRQQLPPRRTPRAK